MPSSCRHCLVTGASAGIGRAIALHLARASPNVRVLAVARRESALQDTKNLLSNAQINQMEIVAHDAACESGRAHIIKSVEHSVSQHGPLDCVVHNAGILGDIGPLADITEDSWRETFAINVEAPLFLTQGLVPSMLGPGARILNVGSGAAHRPIGGWTGYCASKAALHMLYQCLRDELQPNGVLVGSVRCVTIYV